MRGALLAIALIVTAIAASDAQAATRSLYYEVDVRVTTDSEWAMTGRSKCGSDYDLGWENYAQEGSSAMHFSNRVGLPRTLPVRVFGAKRRLRIDLMGERHETISVDQRPVESVQLSGTGSREYKIGESTYEAGADGSCPRTEGDKPRCGGRRFSGDFALVPKGLDGLQVRSRPRSMFDDKDPWGFCFAFARWQTELLPVTGRRRRLAQDLVIAGRKHVSVIASNRDKPKVEEDGYRLPDGSYQALRAETAVKTEVTFVRTTKKKAKELARYW